MAVRILMIFTTLDRGGAETMVMNYLRAIDRSKVIFDFLVHRPHRGAYEDEVESMGCKVFRLPAITLFGLATYRQAVSAFFNDHPEYRHIHGHCSELGFFIYKEAHKRRIPFITAHAHSSPRGFDWKMPIRNILKLWMRPYLSHCFSCGSDSARWLFGKKLSKQAIFLPNAVNASLYSFKRDHREEVRERYGWKDHFIVGNVSQFTTPKNHLFLLDIFVEIVKLEPTALLVLVGSRGNTKAEVEAKVKRLGLESQVRFMGNRSDVEWLLNGMDVILFPSLFEGLPLALIEAQANGLKIIASANIPPQVAILPHLVEYISLKEAPAYWAGQTIQPYERKDTYQQIVDAEFDINHNATWLQNFYLAQNRH